ncbi:redoxin domain-containing protein [bacterium]|nr:MAG: redoxin domain-containing protein [bacterium]
MTIKTITGKAGIGALLLLACILVSAAHASAFRRVQEGSKIEDFTLETIDGKDFSLSKNLGEKATLVIFWASWSPRSVEALADYQKIYEKRSGAGLQVIAINAEHQEFVPGEMGLYRAAVSLAGAKYPVLMDKSLTLYNEYGVSALPSTLLLDSSSTIVYALSGYPTSMRDELREKVDGMLGLGAKPKEPEIHVAAAGKAVRYLRSAQLFQKRGMPHKAIEAIGKAMEEDPNYAEALVLLVELYEKVGEPAKAEETRARLKTLAK